MSFLCPKVLGKVGAALFWTSAMGLIFAGSLWAAGVTPPDAHIEMAIVCSVLTIVCGTVYYLLATRPHPDRMPSVFLGLGVLFWVAAFVASALLLQGSMSYPLLCIQTVVWLLTVGCMWFIVTIHTWNTGFRRDKGEFEDIHYVVNVMIAGPKKDEEPAEQAEASELERLRALSFEQLLKHLSNFSTGNDDDESQQKKLHKMVPELFEDEMLRRAWRIHKLSGSPTASCSPAGSTAPSEKDQEAKTIKKPELNG